MAGYLRELTCPILVVNGAEDTLMPSSQTRKIYDAARPPKDLMLYPGIGHNVWYNTRYVLVECAKWMLNKLNA